MEADTSSNNQVNLEIEQVASNELESNYAISDELTSESIRYDLSKQHYSKVNSLDIYRLIVDTRKFEIENFWKRSLFFWGAIAILLAGYFTAAPSKYVLIFGSYLGFFYNLIFCLSIRGSKYWQEHWESAATTYEKELGFNLFTWNLNTKIKSDNSDIFFLFRPYRISVSKLTMLLSDVTLLFWALLVVKDLRNLSLDSVLKFEFSMSNSFDIYTFTVVFIPIFLFSYIFLFFYTNNKRSKA